MEKNTSLTEGQASKENQSGICASAPGQQLDGTSEAVLQINQLIIQYAGKDSPVLITGETGVGKEVVAGASHAHSRRKEQPFIPLNCASINKELFESELFGHRKGAFTGADRDRPGVLRAADGGTVLLDEIGEMLPDIQTKLLQVIETGEMRPVGEDVMQRVNVRFLFATNRNLEDEVEEGRFRKDLFYRINKRRIHVPPLRERRENIPVLANIFLRKLNCESGKNIALTAGALQKLQDYHFPGNVRELQTLVETAHEDCVFCGKMVIDAEEIEEAIGMGLLSESLAESCGTGCSAALGGRPSGKQASSAGRQGNEAKGIAQELFRRMVENGESFWDVVHRPFLARDLNREQVKEVICMGLARTNGRYKKLLPMFHIGKGEKDYKKFMDFLRKYFLT
jgi:transcriptional regulator with GAF, ATPase, and Fis domain